MVRNTSEFFICIICGNMILNRHYKKMILYCSTKCRELDPITSKNHSKAGKKGNEHRKIYGHTWGDKISKAKTGVPRTDMKGENHFNWKGGTTSERVRDMHSIPYKQWRKSVFERDNYTCQMCGVRGSTYIQADHIKPYAKFPELRYEVSNGRTLCLKCHMKTFSYAIPFNGSEYSVNHLAKIIGRSRRYVMGHFFSSAQI